MPNPQPVTVAQYESRILLVSMRPAQYIGGDTFQVNVRLADGTVKLQAAPTVINVSSGIFAFTLTSAVTGALAVGDYVYDVWRTTPGSECRLAYGPFAVTPEQWK